jgi:hypothetical protein
MILERLAVEVHISTDFIRPCERRIQRNFSLHASLCSLIPRIRGIRPKAHVSYKILSRSDGNEPISPERGNPRVVPAMDLPASDPRENPFPVEKFVLATV